MPEDLLELCSMIGTDTEGLMDRFIALNSCRPAIDIERGINREELSEAIELQRKILARPQEERVNYYCSKRKLLKEAIAVENYEFAASLKKLGHYFANFLLPGVPKDFLELYATDDVYDADRVYPSS